MDFSTFTSEQIEERLSAIKAEISTADETRLDELNAELDGLEARKAELVNIEAQKAEERAIVANDVTLEKITEIPQEERTMKTFEEIRASQEYMDAFAKMVKTGDSTEIRSLASELVSGTVPVPTSIGAYIATAWDKLGLANRAVSFNVKGILNVPYEVSATGAAIHTENGEAPAEETLVLGTAELKPETIKKWITITDEAIAMSSEDFLKYIYDEITYQILLKLDNEVVAKIKASALTDKTQTGLTLDAFTIFKGLAKLADDAVSPIAIMTKDMFFNKVMALADSNGRPIYNIVVENGKPVYSVNGVEVVFNASAGSDIIVGDMRGFGVNYQEGKNVNLITDPYSLAEQDKVKIVGNIKVGLNVIKPKHFAVLGIAVG